jgi:hypothetical protein
VRVSRSTEEAATIDDVPFRCDSITGSYIGDESADFRHIACELVADNERRLASGARPRVPVVDVHVGSTDAGPSHANENFIVANPRLGNFLECEAGTGDCLDECLQVVSGEWNAVVTTPIWSAVSKCSCCVHFPLLIYSRVATNSLRIMSHWFE